MSAADRFTDQVAYHVDYLNRLNLGLQILNVKLRRIERRQPWCAERAALIAVVIETEQARDELRERVARDCAPWF